VFALVDGNCFYCSCERIFRPDLKNKPVVVLSNNDGCVVARTPEAKAMGIKMAVPYFQIAHLEQKGLVTFSSNYELYGNISERMMQTIASVAPRIEIYSIDECFADLGGLDCAHLKETGHLIRHRLAQWVGIPSCVGIAPTKTLAKFCNHLAKKYPSLGGVVVWDDWSTSIQDRALKSENIAEVWGIGRRSGNKLENMNIKTVYDFIIAHPAMIRKKFTVVLERVQKELQGIACLSLEEISEPKKMIICSKSFGKNIQDIQNLQSAISFHITRAAEKLRQQQSGCHTISIFISTDRFKKQQRYYGTHTVTLPNATCSTLKLNQIAQDLLKKVYKPNHLYKKCGVVLGGIESINDHRQLDMLTGADEKKVCDLMMTLDHINRRFGKQTIRLAIEDLSHEWLRKRERMSPRYTTSMSDVLIIN
jgi:DNA polymerase V